MNRIPFICSLVLSMQCHANSPSPAPNASSEDPRLTEAKSVPMEFEVLSPSDCTKDQISSLLLSELDDGVIKLRLEFKDYVFENLQPTKKKVTNNRCRIAFDFPKAGTYVFSESTLAVKGRITDQLTGYAVVRIGSVDDAFDGKTFSFEPFLAESVYQGSDKPTLVSGKKLELRLKNFTSFRALEKVKPQDSNTTPVPEPTVVDSLSYQSLELILQPNPEKADPGPAASTPSSHPTMVTQKI